MPLLAMAELRHFLQVLTGFAYTVAGVLAHPLMLICHVLELSLNIQLPPQISHWVEVWREMLEMLLTEPFLCCSGDMCGVFFIFNVVTERRRFFFKSSQYIFFHILSLTVEVWMKITDSCLFEWDNLHNQWLPKYFLPHCNSPNDSYCSTYT